MDDLSRSKIYIIKNNTTGQYYIGSTRASLQTCFVVTKYNAKKKTHKLHNLFQNGECYIELLYEKHISSSAELNAEISKVRALYDKNEPIPDAINYASNAHAREQSDRHTNRYSKSKIYIIINLDTGKYFIGGTTTNDIDLKLLTCKRKAISTDDELHHVFKDGNCVIKVLSTVNLRNKHEFDIYVSNALKTYNDDVVSKIIRQVQHEFNNVKKTYIDNNTNKSKRKTNDFSDSKIFIVRNTTTNKYYIDGTTGTLKTKFASLKRKALHGNTELQELFNNGECYIELITTANLENRFELDNLVLKIRQTHANFQNYNKNSTETTVEPVNEPIYG